LGRFRQSVGVRELLRALPYRITPMFASSQHLAGIFHGKITLIKAVTTIVLVVGLLGGTAAKASLAYTISVALTAMIDNATSTPSSSSSSAPVSWIQTFLPLWIYAGVMFLQVLIVTSISASVASKALSGLSSIMPARAAKMKCTAIYLPIVVLPTIIVGGVILLTLLPIFTYLLHLDGVRVAVSNFRDVLCFFGGVSAFFAVVLFIVGCACGINKKNQTGTGPCCAAVFFAIFRSVALALLSIALFYFGIVYGNNIDASQNTTASVIPVIPPASGWYSVCILPCLFFLIGSFMHLVGIFFDILAGKRSLPASLRLHLLLSSLANVFLIPAVSLFILLVSMLADAVNAGDSSAVLSPLLPVLPIYIEAGFSFVLSLIASAMMLAGKVRMPQNAGGMNFADIVDRSTLR